MAEVLTDIKLDFQTGRVVIDTVTGDAVLISGNEVILQDTAIRLNTQIGSVKGQLIDAFGWDFLNRIKDDVDVNFIASVARKIQDVVLEDERILDVEVLPNQMDVTETLSFRVNIEIERGEILSLPFNLAA